MRLRVRQAISAANAAPGEDTIVFDLGPSETITLSEFLGQLVVTDNAGLIIDGGNAKITVSGADQTTIFTVARAKLTLQNLIVSDGKPFRDLGGGGALNLGGTLS
ncbi:MAG: hypothetical protein H0U55_10850, partial [Rubrobacteraceae bacterium]|nr:hypothetical protein [Rubrobacteraceae bacterium]